MFEYKVVPYEYFMDKLNDWELETIIRYIPYSNRQEWNIARNIMLATLKPYLKDKSTTAQKLVPLVGDDGYEEEGHNIEITNEEIARLTEQADIVSKILSKTQDNEKCQTDLVLNWL